MSVSAFDRSRRLSIVPVPTSDNLLFVGYLVAVIGGYLYGQALQSPEFVIFLIFVGGIAVGVCFGALEIISYRRLRKLKAVRLPVNDAASGFQRVLEREKKEMGLPQDAFSVFWIPANWRVGARVLSGFNRKLVITGKACVAAAKEDPAALFVLRHELAHIKNRDTRLYIAVLYAYMVPVAMLFGPTDEYLQIVLNVVMVFIVSTFLLRRREYLADAVAANAGSSGTEYFDFLSRLSSSETGWFHPSAKRRVTALTNGSPVLAISWRFLALCVLAVEGAEFNIHKADAAALYQGKLPPDFTRHDIVFLMTIASLLAMFFEIAKNRRRKTPADSSIRLGVWSDKRWIPAFCALNGCWWAMTVFFRLLLFEVFAREQLLGRWIIGSCMAVVIAALWFVVGFGLLRYKLWAKRAAIVLALVSVLGHIIEFIYKQDLQWFGWYVSSDYDPKGIMLMLLILIGTGLAVAIGLLSPKRMSILTGPMDVSTPVSQRVLGPVSMLLLISGTMIMTLLPLATGQTRRRAAQKADTWSRADDSSGEGSPAAPSEGAESVAENTQLADTAPPVAIQVPPSFMNTLLVSRVEPVYPPDAKTGHFHGSIVVGIIIAKNGEVERAELISGPPELASAATEAVKKWKYKAYTLNGEPVEVTTKVTLKVPNSD